jgi:hypothetical protein
MEQKQLSYLAVLTAAIEMLVLAKNGLIVRDSDGRQNLSAVNLRKLDSFSQ